MWPAHVPGLFGPMVASFVMSAALAGRTGVVELVGRMSTTALLIGVL